MECQHISRYTILEQVREDRFGTVYHAQDSETGQDVLLRVMHPRFSPDQQVVQRFLTEMQAVTRLHHPCIARIEAVEYIDGQVCIVTEMVQGPTLAETIRKRGRIRWADMLALLLPICNALDYVHAQGLVHGNLTPDRMVVAVERGPLLTDLGLALVLANSRPDQRSTAGAFSNPNYAAPEIWHGSPPTPMSDVYALGCIVYEMLNGEQLFRGKDLEQLRRAHEHGPRFPTLWPEKLADEAEDILRKALARDPDTRYQSVSALQQALQNFTEETTRAAEALPRVSPLWSRVLPIVTWVLITLVILVLIWVAVVIRETRDSALATPLGIAVGLTYAAV